MSKCVVYQSGGFTNDGIGYRKFSLEELEEMKKENDKKLLSDYIDACEMIRETEKQIRRKLFEGLTWEESKKSDLIKEG